MILGEEQRLRGGRKLPQTRPHHININGLRLVRRDEANGLHDRRAEPARKTGGKASAPRSRIALRSASSRRFQRCHTDN